MKRGEAWYKRYSRDIYEGTRQLSLEERGAYNDILDLIYMHGGPIPDDAKWMSHALHVSTRKWTAIREALLNAGKIECEAGEIMNARARVELDSKLAQARTNAEIATNRERKKSENFEKTNENNETAARNEHLTRARQIQIQSQKEENTPSSVPPVPKAKPPRGARLRPDWTLPDEWLSWTRINFAHAGEPQVRAEADKFRDYWIAKAGQQACKLDWEATWRNWCRVAFAAKPSALPVNIGRMNLDEAAAARRRKLIETSRRMAAESIAREAAHGRA